MANKKITDLQLISALTSGVQLLVDDGIQSYRATMAQIRDYIVPIPAGAMMPFAGSTAPTGFLLCAGQAVSRTTYAALFTAIGTTYGVGDGSTTFNLPDLRGRVPAGKDNMNGSAASRLTTAGSAVDGATLGAAGGAQNVTLTSGEVPSHTHSFSGTTSGQSTNHYHDNAIYNNYSSVYGGYGGSNGSRAISNGVSGASTSGQATSPANTDHSHTYSGTTGSSGTGGAHNNVQPTLVANYIIRH